MTKADQSRQIAALNDAFRSTFRGGTLILTSGIQALSQEVQVGILYAVRKFDAFTSDNDSHGEHDFGSIEYQGNRVFWKIDYYDPSMTFHSENPTNPMVTERVLSVMLAEEY